MGEENQGLLKTREDLRCGQLAVMGFPACRPTPSPAGPGVGTLWGGSGKRGLATYPDEGLLFANICRPCKEKFSKILLQNRTMTEYKLTCYYLHYMQNLLQL